DRGVRAAAGLDAGDAVRRQRSRAHQEFGVPFGVDVVGDRRDVVALAHRLAKQVHQRGLAGTYGTTDADPKRAVGIFHFLYSNLVRRPCHDLNSRVYCVSWRMPARSARKVELPRSSSEAASARAPVATTIGSSAASTRWLSVCPSGTSRAPAEIQFETTACRNAWIVGGSGIACAALTMPTATG